MVVQDLGAINSSAVSGSTSALTQSGFTQAIPDAQLALLRAPDHGAPIAHLMAWPLREVAHATIDQSSFGFPLAQITVTATSAGWTDIRVGQLIEITDGGGMLITTSIVRLPPTSTILYIAAMGRGDPGRAQAIAIDLANGYTVTIYDFMPMWSLLSRIKNGVFLKAFDRPYSDQGSNPTPVCNIGQWRHAWSVGGVARLTFSALASRAWHGKTITSYLWSFDGVYTIISGTLSSATITIEHDEGFFLAHCVVGDSGGKTREGIRPCWITPMWGDGAPLSSERAVLMVGTDHQDLQGRSITYEIYGSHDIDRIALYDGAAVLHVEYATHGGDALDSGVITDHYVGFIDDLPHMGNVALTTLTVTTKSPLLRLSNVAEPPQVIMEVSSPSKWVEILAGLGDPSFAAFYVLQHQCPNALTLFDFHSLADAPRKSAYGLNGRSIQAQLNEVMAMVCGNIGSASDGSFFFFRNPNMESESFRNALETRLTVGTGDFLGDITYPQLYYNPTGSVIMGAFVVGVGDNTTMAFDAIAPDISTGQGVGNQSGQTIIASGLQELLDKVGHELARLNNPSANFQQKMNRNFDVFDPARHYNTWAQLNIEARFDPRGIGYNGRALATAVDRAWTAQPKGAAHKSVTVTYTTESEGKPGVELPKTQLSNQPYDVLYADAPPFANISWASDDQGGFGATVSFLNTVVQWTNIRGAITGIVTDFDFDYASPLFRSGLRSGALGMWAVSINGSTLKIWYAPNVLIGHPVWTNQATYTMVDGATSTQARLLANRRVAGNAWVFWRSRVKTYGVKTLDGSTWSVTPTQVGVNSTSDASNDDAPIGACIEGDHVLVTAPTAVVGGVQYHLFYADALIGSFQPVPGYPTSSAPNPMIQPGVSGTVYATTLGDPIHITEPVGDGTTTPLVGTTTSGPYSFGSWAFPCVGILPVAVFGVSAAAPIDTYTDITYISERHPFDGYTGEWHCTEIDVGISIQSWHFPVGSVSAQALHYVIELVNLGGGTVYTHSGDISHTPGTSSASDCFVTNVTLAGLDVDHVHSIRITITGTFIKVAADQEIWASVFFTSLALDRDIVLRGFWRVEHYAEFTGSLPPPLWVDIIPSDAFVPVNKYALAPDSASQRFSALVFEPTETDLYVSNNGGNSSVIVAADTNYDGVRRSGQRAILWGNGKLDYSANGGLTLYSRIGNWATAVGTVGRWLRVAGIT